MRVILSDGLREYEIVRWDDVTVTGALTSGAPENHKDSTAKYAVDRFAPFSGRVHRLTTKHERESVGPRGASHNPLVTAEKKPAAGNALSQKGPAKPMGGMIPGFGLPQGGRGAAGNGGAAAGAGGNAPRTPPRADQQLLEGVFEFSNTRTAVDFLRQCRLTDGDIRGIRRLLMSEGSRAYVAWDYTELVLEDLAWHLVNGRLRVLVRRIKTGSPWTEIVEEAVAPPQAPAAPTYTPPPPPEPEQPVFSPDVDPAAQADTMRDAAEQGVPFCEECARLAAQQAAEATFPPSVDQEALAEVLDEAAEDGVPFCEECEKERERERQRQQAPPPEPAAEVDDPPTFEPKVDQPAVATVLTEAAQSGVPFCEECAKAAAAAETAGATGTAGAGGDGAVAEKPPTSTPPTVVKPKLVSVEWLDGSDTTELAADGIQWVNLPREAKWVGAGSEGKVPNIDRLGQKPRVKVKFDKPGASAFKLKVVPDGANVVYTGTEKGRNPNFTFVDTEKSYTTDGDGTKIIDSEQFLTAAGMAVYSVEATDDDGNKATSKKLTAKRLMFLQRIDMTGLAAAASDISAFIDEFAKHGIVIVPLGATTMARMENISSGADETTYQASVKTAYTASGAAAKAPYVVALGFTDQLAVKDANQTVVKAGVTVGPGAADVLVPIVNSSGASKYLWNDVVTGEDWFVSAEFLADGATAPVSIAKTDCTPTGTAGMFARVSVKVSGIGTAAATGKITLKVNWVNRMRGGLSFPGGNLICVCARSWWKDKPAPGQNQTIVHEMGHKVGMVADGTGTGPDKVATFYDNAKGHVGPHCHNGLPASQARYDGPSDTASSICTMFGASNGKVPFCDNCAPAVKKEDLSAGWPTMS